ncbi:hypothetical protein LV84_01379 [Algoriphagus ratkowskyi]|uniref:Terpene synthase n=1 Tax=Algoriphagus ratkowskyi TaxID=57028 RepID=A0A2W7REH2_9BACT|nr:terpene synthase family protein [Algoriphagus ratkowskyi]PZX59348.1 hypothetical protein LV84_01379 [Algoriphagus ratkowskyi]TXD77386.1 hypothetical protein ESW18_11300 [Algoriphagus ratkowskyi]
MNFLNFPSALHVKTRYTDESVLKWAETWLVTSDGNPDWEIIERCRVQQLNWFTCYLFPGMELNKLERIAKLFFCLFILDDLLDLMDDEEAEGFLQEMAHDQLIEGKMILTGLGLPIDTCYLDILECFSQEALKDRFQRAWNLHIAGLEWEMKNRRGKWKLTLEDYQYMRPHSSGVYIAIELLRGDILFNSDTMELENDIARFVCLSNDLVSAPKERAIGDMHNEVLLLSEEYGEEVAIEMVKGELSYLQKKIRTSSILISQVSMENKIWVDGLLLLLGGCLYWSAETERYNVSGD